jgi:predicted phosphodiesterase
MRVAVLSDIHGNIEAFEKVLDDLKNRNIDDIWFLGDAINYCCDSDKVIERLRTTVDLENWIAGNHEELFWGATELQFSQESMTMMEYTRELLNNSREGNFLVQNETKIPKTSIKRVRDNIVVLAHHRPIFTPFNLDIYTTSYLFPLTTALVEVLSTPVPESMIPPSKKRWFPFAKTTEETKIFLCGHTHIPCLAYLDLGCKSVVNVQVNGNRFLYKKAKQTYPQILINPGSVGYSRDNCPRASYAIIDFLDNFVEFFRVKYDFNINKFHELINKTEDMHKKTTINALTQNIKNAGMPEELLLRLPDDWYNFYQNQRCEN